MSRIDRVAGASAASVGRTKSAPAPGGFSVAEGGISAERVAKPSAPQPAGLAGMLALQEAEAETAGNRKARRQGLAMLDALQALQQGLLSASQPGEALAKLVTLAGDPASVTDPKLAEVLAAIRLRARIELLRRGFESG
jgi:hypothetical protein